VLKRWWDESVNEVAYYIEGTNIRGTTYIKDLKPYKEQETMKNTRVSINDNGDKVSLVTLTSEITEIEVGKNYEIKEVNGKYYAVKKKPKYPSSYEECCNILGVNPERILTLNWRSENVLQRYELEAEGLFTNLYKLKICRDAYWKIAGEQGLGKPWKPRWNDNYQSKWTIYFYQDNINLTDAPNVHFILAFPTKEVRDTFCENFKELIETCKELL
jgi:hypothetical protein